MSPRSYHGTTRHEKFPAPPVAEPHIKKVGERLTSAWESPRALSWSPDDATSSHSPSTHSCSAPQATPAFAPWQSPLARGRTCRHCTLRPARRCRPGCLDRRRRTRPSRRSAYGPCWGRCRRRCSSRAARGTTASTTDFAATAAVLGIELRVDAGAIAGSGPVAPAPAVLPAAPALPPNATSSPASSSEQAGRGMNQRSSQAHEFEARIPRGIVFDAHGGP